MKKLFLHIMILVISICFSNARADFDIKARTVILQDFLSGKILYEKDADRIIFPASMTKIMTSIIAFDLLKKNEISQIWSCSKPV